MTFRTPATCLLLLSSALCAFPEDTPASGAEATWSPKAAGAYLDQRMAWWTEWPTAARDHDTFCISCHTALPYAVARPALRAALEEPSRSALETKVIENVTKRVRMWNEVAPFYPDSKKDAAKTAESRGTESILNALILTSNEAGSGTLSPDAKLALDNLWGQQLQAGEAKGGWAWLQFHNAPWEGDSQFYGSTLAALAVGFAPADYRANAAVKAKIAALGSYLERERGSQTLLDRVILVWASTKMPELLAPLEREAIVKEALSKQQEDGGFSLSSFVGGWQRRDKTPLETKSDGYATGVVTFVLEQTGMRRTQPQIVRALAWLRQNQDKTEGRWLAYSLNKQRDLGTDVGRFMSDAATAYAVLALSPGK